VRGSDGSLRLVVGSPDGPVDGDVLLLVRQFSGVDSYYDGQTCAAASHRQGGE